ncbi:MAG: hypothetical protein FJ202_08035 [Gemmatimonadetes bacterium]|nr:hypothetical protein [Gemmatimonadota bacterium]
MRPIASWNFRRIPSRLWGLARRRCPNCERGPIFPGLTPRMHAQCPVCRYVFEREPGYFLGALAIGYFLAVALSTAVALMVRRVWPTLDWEWCFAIGFGVYLLSASLVFQYARSVWMYVDFWLDPPGA